MKANLARLAVASFVSVSLIVLPSTLAFASNSGGLNVWATDGKLAFKVTAIHCGQKSISSADGFSTDKAQGMFCVISLIIKNIGNQAQMPDDSAQYLYDTQGRQYSADTTADLDLNAGPIWQFTNLNPGLSISGTLYFDVPIGTQLASLQVHDSALSGGASINLEGATLGPWQKDRVVSGMVALHVITEELNTTCANSTKEFGLTPATFLKVYGESHQFLVSVQLGKGYASTDRNSKGKKVPTCDFSSQIWVPFNQKMYSFRFSTGSMGQTTTSGNLIHKIQSSKETLFFTLS